MVRWDRPYRAAGIARNAPVADCPGQAPRFVQEKENFSYPERAVVVLQPEPVLPQAQRAGGEGEKKKKKKKKRKARWEVLVEIVEVAVLAIVAVATAWSGYQSARWDGQQSLQYGHATTDRFKAGAASTYGGQELADDSAMFTAYLQARSAGNSKLEMLYVRRFTPGYRVAFVAWLKTDPFTNPAAPPGPGLMPQYAIRASSPRPG